MVFFFFFLFFFHTLYTACRSDHGRIYWVDEERKVRVEFGSGGTDLTGYQVNQIGPDGTRNLSENFEFGAELTFQLDNDYILKEKFSLAETVAAMGDPLPEYTDRSAAVARVEVRSGNLTGSFGKTMYSQIAIPLLQSDIIAASQDVFFQRRINLEEVSYQKVKVLDLSTREPIEKASVIAVISGLIASDVDPGKNIDAWKGELFRPVTEYTDSNGEAILLPLNHELGEKSRFSVIAYAQNYCTYVSHEISLGSENPPEILLRKCDDADLTTVGFKASFVKESYKVHSESVNEVQREVGYVTDTKVPVRIDSLSPVMRGIKIKLTEKHITSDGDRQEHPSIPTVDFSDKLNGKKFKFLSETVVDVPLIFTYTNQESGDFLLHVFLSKFENELVSEANQTNTLFFRKNTKLPDTSFVKDLKVSGPVKSGVISGKSGTRFSIESQECTEGMELGLAESGGSVVFNKCENSFAFFDKDTFPLFTDSATSGGFATFRAYIKDRYGLINQDDDTGNSNSIQVFVDYAAPDLTSNPLILGSRLGFAYNGTEKGTDSIAYVFPFGTLSGGSTDTVILKPSTVEGTVVFRFSAPENCISNTGANPSGDGASGGNQGVEIARLMLSATSETASSGDWFSCSDGTNPTDISVKSSYINFPSNSTDNATFYLKVMDAAGHESDPYLYSIPPCPANVETTSGTSYCWKN